MKKFLAVFLTIVIGFSLSGCGNKISDKDIRKILQKNGASESKVKDIDVVEQYALDNVKGASKNSSLVVFTSDHDTYALAVVSKKDGTLNTLNGNKILGFLIDEINFNGGEYKNKKNAELCKNYLEKYGMNCFNEKHIAEKYIKEVTEKSILGRFPAQSAVKEGIEKTTGYKDFDIIFEKKTAIPKYYAVKEEKLVYNWSGFFDESVYKVWEASTDRSTQNTMRALYGAPYVMKEVWSVLDSDFKPVGTYNSLSEIEKKYSN